MKTYKNIYGRICSIDNLVIAFKKAKRGKSKKFYVPAFEKNLDENLKNLQKELLEFTYKPKKLKKFIIRDPKTRTIYASAFVDRIVHHAIINLIESIFEKVFIYDSFASRKGKGAHLAIKRFCEFMKKVSGNARLVKNAINNNQIEGYCLKADIKSYFDNVNHEVLLNIIRKKFKDNNTIWIIKNILDNFDAKKEGNSRHYFENNKELLKSNCSGMPLGNLTSQFFANVYLNELDYFVKHELKAKYYIRYVDDFIILHRSKKRLAYFQARIDEFLRKNLKIWLHPQKSKILALRNGITFLGYRIFYNYKLLIKRNIRLMRTKIVLFKQGKILKKNLKDTLKGWEGYAKWANSYGLRQRIIAEIYK